jgi:enamine deaminase RidA (YjgF/YER057c/UK114 family)
LHLTYYVGPRLSKRGTKDQKWKDVTEVLDAFWKENGVPQFSSENYAPASTLLGISSLAQKEMLIEIQAVAALPPLD